MGFRFSVLVRPVQAMAAGAAYQERRGRGGADDEAGDEDQEEGAGARGHGEGRTSIGDVDSLPTEARFRDEDFYVSHVRYISILHSMQSKNS
jgi:DBP10CT (NUC160) domain